MATMEDFRSTLDAYFRDAATAVQAYVEVLSRDLHDAVMEGDPAQRMPMACAAMHGAVRTGDEIMEASPSGQTSRLRIRYRLPR